MEYNLFVILQGNKLLPKHSVRINSAVRICVFFLHKLQNVLARLHHSVLLFAHLERGVRGRG